MYILFLFNGNKPAWESDDSQYQLRPIVNLAN